MLRNRSEFTKVPSAAVYSSEVWDYIELMNKYVTCPRKNNIMTNLFFIVRILRLLVAKVFALKSTNSEILDFAARERALLQGSFRDEWNMKSPFVKKKGFTFSHVKLYYVGVARAHDLPTDSRPICRTFSSSKSYSIGFSMTGSVDRWSVRTAGSVWDEGCDKKWSEWQEMNCAQKEVMMCIASRKASVCQGGAHGGVCCVSVQHVLRVFGRVNRLFAKRNLCQHK